MFKAARKGKNKLVSVVVAAEVEFVENGGYTKPPQHQWKFYLGTTGGSLSLL
jgi:hypothetical protein